MKLIIALAAAGIVSSLIVITPANAQKDPACTEKCNRDNKVEGGGRQARGTGKLIRACVSACRLPKRAERQSDRQIINAILLAARGIMNVRGTIYSATSIRSMLAARPPLASTRVPS